MQELVKCQGVSVVVQLLALERAMMLQMQAAAILQALPPGCYSLMQQQSSIEHISSFSNRTCSLMFSSNDLYACVLSWRIILPAHKLHNALGS